MVNNHVAATLNSIRKSLSSPNKQDNHYSLTKLKTQKVSKNTNDKKTTESPDAFPKNLIKINETTSKYCQLEKTGGLE